MGKFDRGKPNKAKRKVLYSKTSAEDNPAKKSQTRSGPKQTVAIEAMVSKNLDS